MRATVVGNELRNAELAAKYPDRADRFDRVRTYVGLEPYPRTVGEQRLTDAAERVTKRLQRTPTSGVLPKLLSSAKSGGLIRTTGLPNVRRREPHYLSLEDPFSRCVPNEAAQAEEWSA